MGTEAGAIVGGIIEPAGGEIPGAIIGNYVENELPALVEAAPKIETTVMEIEESSVRVLQTGGHTLKNSTLRALGLTKEQGKNALEALKNFESVKANDHGKILSDGSLLSKAGDFIGNIFDFVKSSGSK